MTIEQLIAFNIALFAALASPGPAMLLSVHMSLSAGRRAGVLAGAGLALMAAIWTLAALFGLQALFAIAPWLYVVLKICGALYLLYIAAKMWRGADAPLERRNIGRGAAFYRGVLVNLLNPKSFLFAAALLLVIFPEELKITDKVLIFFNQFLIEILFYAALAIGLSRQRVAERYFQAKRWLDRAAAAVLSALGLRLLLSR